MKRKIPKFIADAGITANSLFVETYRIQCPNWLEIHKRIKAMTPSPANLRTVCMMMLAEYERPEGARMDIIARLYGKFNRMRTELERVDL